LLAQRNTSRFFSTFSKIQGNSIQLSSSIPTRIKIPINSTHTIDGPVKESLKDVKVHADKNISIDELVKKRFDITANGKLYHVHPDISTMVTLKNREKVEEILGVHQFPGVRRNILSMFLDHLITYLPKEEITKAELKKAIKKAVESKYFT